MGGSTRLILAAVLAAFTAGRAAAAPIDLVALAVSGEPAVGVPDDVRDPVIDDFGWFRTPFSALNAHGQVAFTASYDAGGAQGVWLAEADGTIAPVVAGQGVWSDAQGAVLAYGASPALNDTGQIAFVGGLEGPGVDSENARGIWLRDGHGAPVLVLRQGDVPPGAPADWSVADLGPEGLIQLTNSGDIAFNGWVTGPELPNPAGNQAVFGPDGSGGVRLLAATGAQAPGVPAGQTFGPVDDRWVLGSGGRVAFQATLHGGGVGQDRNTGIWGTDETGELALVVREGDPAPGVESGVVWRGFGEPVLDPDGRITFLAGFRIGEGGVDDTNDLAIYQSAPGGEPELVFRAGEQAPGAPDGAVFDRFQRMDTNAAGDLAVSVLLATGAGGVTTEDDVAILFREEGGTDSLVVREGQLVENLLGVSFGSLGTPILNDRGDVAFISLLEGPEVDEGNDHALFFAAGGANPIVVVREGDALEVRPGDVRTVSDFFYHVVAVPGREFMNDARQLTFVAIFEDGSSAVVLATVPEPGTAGLLALGLLGLAGRSRIARTLRGSRHP